MSDYEICEKFSTDFGVRVWFSESAWLKLEVAADIF
jgi:hypothetical protein